MEILSEKEYQKLITDEMKKEEEKINKLKVKEVQQIKEDSIKAIKSMVEEKQKNGI